MDFVKYESVYDYKTFIENYYAVFERKLTVSEVLDSESYLEYRKFIESLDEKSIYLDVEVMCGRYERICVNDDMSYMFNGNRVEILCSDVKKAKRSYPLSIGLLMLRYFLSRKYVDKKVQFALVPW